MCFMCSLTSPPVSLSSSVSHYPAVSYFLIALLCRNSAVIHSVFVSVSVINPVCPCISMLVSRCMPIFSVRWYLPIFSHMRVCCTLLHKWVINYLLLDFKVKPTCCLIYKLILALWIEFSEMCFLKHLPESMKNKWMENMGLMDSVDTCHKSVFLCCQYFKYLNILHI